jgi:hypothetical protein
MGWKSRATAVLLGLFLLSGGLWPVSLVCFVFALVPGNSRSVGKEAMKSSKGFLTPRHFVGIVFILLGLVAISAGGTLSPIVFLALGAVVMAWPRMHLGILGGGVRPHKDSVLLRSKYIPVSWSAVAELKPGADSYPRAISSFDGRLAVFTGSGKAYLIASCTALSSQEAESKLLTLLRSASPTGNVGAYLLPLEASAAQEVFKLKLSSLRIAFSEGNLTPPGPGLLLLECSKGVVRKAAAFTMEAAKSATIPSGTALLGSAPLTWEVLESLGRRTSWPDPDSMSNLLDSFVASRGVPLGERLKSLEGAGTELMVESLAGDQLKLSRSQFRAIVSIYS